MKTFVLLASSIGVMVAVSSCGPLECTEVGCNTPLEVRIEPTTGHFAPGSYVVELVQDGVVSSCTFEITGESEGGSFDGNCGPYGDPAMQSTLGSWTPDTIFLQLWSGAHDLTLSVSRDGDTLLTSSTQQTYATSEPNGHACGPVCINAPPLELQMEGLPDDPSAE